MTLLSTVRPVPSRNSETASRGEETASPKLVRSASPGKSRLTIRLPDLNNPRRPAAAPSTPAPPAHLPLAGSTSMAPEMEHAAGNENGDSRQTATARSAPVEWLHAFSRKTIGFVRQPKFWLACVVAVAVQVVLAFAMTPAEDAPDGQKPEQAPAPAWQKAAEEPAARIVVPAAPASVPDEHADTVPAVTTPMGPAFSDPASDAAGHGGVPQTTAGPEQPAPTAFVADNHPRATGVAGAVDQPVGGDGATLGGIAPFDPEVSPDQHETR